MTRTHKAEYNVWNNLNARCGNKPGYEHVSICARWSGPRGFRNFVADMGRRPAGTTLDRVKNSRGYSKANCRWATAIEQARNRRNVRIICVNGEQHPITSAIALMRKAARDGSAIVCTITAAPRTHVARRRASLAEPT